MIFLKIYYILNVQYIYLPGKEKHSNCRDNFFGGVFGWIGL